MYEQDFLYVGRSIMEPGSFDFFLSQCFSRRCRRYIYEPTSCEYTDVEGDECRWVCILNQAPFGLRGSAYLWNEEMNCELCQIGFHPLEDDLCAFTL
mgnify:FL=1|jgi:hypothetical protein